MSFPSYDEGVYVKTVSSGEVEVSVCHHRYDPDTMILCVQEPRVLHDPMHLTIDQMVALQKALTVALEAVKNPEVREEIETARKRLPI